MALRSASCHASPPPRPRDSAATPVASSTGEGISSSVRPSAPASTPEATSRPARVSAPMRCSTLSAPRAPLCSAAAPITALVAAGAGAPTTSTPRSRAAPCISGCLRRRGSPVSASTTTAAVLGITMPVTARSASSAPALAAPLPARSATSPHCAHAATPPASHASAACFSLAARFARISVLHFSATVSR